MSSLVSNIQWPDLTKDGLEIARKISPHIYDYCLIKNNKLVIRIIYTNEDKFFGSIRKEGENKCEDALIIDEVYSGDFIGIIRYALVRMKSYMDTKCIMIHNGQFIRNV